MLMEMMGKERNALKMNFIIAWVDSSLLFFHQIRGQFSHLIDFGFEAYRERKIYLEGSARRLTSSTTFD
jgi:hypothetical protein